jgi:hypothetical protein
MRRRKGRTGLEKDQTEENVRLCGWLQGCKLIEPGGNERRVGGAGEGGSGVTKRKG